MTQTSQNRLAAETSPYLRQHADNPVDWYPWSEEALALAGSAGKPILLSIGYSACHWCHVMAHESFEDQATAQLMNEHFVNIKVDREERPDIDKIYQTAHQLLTQRAGGWPLTMFLDPRDQRPFFGGTYFPKTARYGMPSFDDLLVKVSEYFADNADQVREQAEQLVAVFPRLEPAAAGEDERLNAKPLDSARSRIADSFDREYGGIGTQPKFPHPTTFDRLLRHWRASANTPEPDVDALFMVSLTLTRMAEGGIYDHLGGGFCRYSVDRYWQIPHFEKMLYDNGPLLALYAQAHVATGEVLFKDVAIETAEYVLADLRAPNGGFFSTRDADSEGAEGKFYVWTPDAVKALLTPEAYAPFARRYGLDQPANFEGEWHLTVHEPLEAIANGDEQTLRRDLERAHKTLYDAREQRIHPGRDEKQLTSWNALAIRGLAIAGRSLGRADFISAAVTGIDFVREHLLADGRLLASFKDGSARFAAYLDDHAFMLDAILETLQAQWSNRHLSFAVQLAELMLTHFEDSESGGFYFTASDAEKLIARPKPLADEAMPSGNGVAAFALQRLGFLLGETRYLEAAERTLRYAWKAMDEYPHGHVTLLTALEEYLDHPETVLIRGEETEIAAWQESAAKLYAPRRMVFAIAAAETDLPGVLSERRAAEGETVAYRCVGSHCSLPLTSFEALAAELSEL